MKPLKNISANMITDVPWKIMKLVASTARMYEKRCGMIKK